MFPRKKFFKISLVCVFIFSLGVYFYRSDYCPRNLSDLKEIFFFLKEIFSKNSQQEVISTENIEKERIINKEKEAEKTKETENKEIKEFDDKDKESDGDKENNKDDKENNNQKTSSLDNLDNDNKEKSLPEFVNHYIPFIPQAPLGNWDKIHEEACEEACLLLAHYFLSQKKLVLSQEAERDLQKLSDFTKNNYPKKDDLNVLELVEVAKKYFGYKNFQVVNNPTLEDLKRGLAQGSIIIAPMAGRILNNPYFKTPGPLYHMLIISGYDNKKGIFITQDPGTKRGKDFSYSYKTIMDSLHDFPGEKEKIKEGNKSIVFVNPVN